MVQFNHAWLMSWLPGTSESVSAISDKLNIQGFETEAQSSLSLEGIVVGEIVACGPHPKADRLSICSVRVGNDQILSIVCGCPTVRSGIKVACAQVGSKVNGLLIERRELRGVLSEGMLCSQKELGLSSSTKGIWHLSADAPVGKSLSHWLQADSNAYAIDVTPNRGDAMSVRGIARELSIAFDCTLTQPWDARAIPKKVADLPNPLCQAHDACSAFHLVKFGGITKDVTIPDWMAVRLIESGIALHHPVVDILNYVMLETGQPMHAYDASVVSGQFDISYAKSDESLELINGKKVALDAQSLVIRSADKPVCIAGYMGGSESQVQDHTASIYLEVAAFSPSIIAYNCRRYQYHTQSGSRFERGMDPGYTYDALLRAVSLLQDLLGAELLGYAAYQAPSSQPVLVDVTYDYLQKLLGFSYSNDAIFKSLNAAGFEVQANDAGFCCVVPSWRNEVHLPCHIASELVRINGLPEGNTHSMQAHLGKPIRHFEKISSSISAYKKWLCANGFYETLSYSFQSHEKAKHFFASHENLISLSNPLSEDYTYLRSSLWPNLLTQMRMNLHKQHADVRLFETGRCYVHTPDGVAIQPRYLGMVMCGRVLCENWLNADSRYDFFRAKSIVDRLLSIGSKVKPSAQPQIFPGLHPSQSAVYKQDNVEVAIVGVIHPRLARVYDVPEDTCLLQLNLDALHNDHYENNMARRPSPYPTLRRDLSFMVPQNVEFEIIEKKIEECLHCYLKYFVLFDIYSGRQVLEGFKSFSLGFVFQHEERSLQEADIQVMIDRFINELKTCGIMTRGDV